MKNIKAIHISEFERILGSKKYNEFYNLFDKVYYSHKIGFRKPHAEAFRLILNENKLSAHEVFFIDDSPQHIEGTKK
jgi:putative hydrolase of the HAD superfamily